MKDSNHSTIAGGGSKPLDDGTNLDTSGDGIPFVPPTDLKIAWPPPHWSEDVRNLITSSGITEDVGRSRGYIECYVKAEFEKSYRYTKQQASHMPIDNDHPGLVIPMFDASAGEPGIRCGYSTRLTRPDVDVKNKYKKPKGQRNALDCNPLSHAAVHDAEVPLWITEGVRKSDSLLSFGARAAISLDGVWGWTGGEQREAKGGYQNPGKKGSKANAEWERIPLEGRTVYICFDIDVYTNRNVAAARRGLTAHLISLGAEVSWVTPPKDGSEGKGVDDYLVSGHTLNELLAFTTAPDSGRATAGLREILIGPQHAGGLGFDPELYDWVKSRLGTPALPGFYIRGPELVRTPLIGEDGYRPPDNPRDSDGPAQFRAVTRPISLRVVIQDTYDVQKITVEKVPGGEKIHVNPAIFPELPCALALAGALDNPAVPRLHGVTHTPILRPDGSILTKPGYDESTSYLFLPSRGTHFREIPQEVDDTHLCSAVANIEYLLQDFMFVTPTDKAVYISMMLTPILKLVVPPPYPLIGIDGPTSGSGKTLLASLAAELFDWVFRSDLNLNDMPEFKKSITSILRSTTAPYVVFDNVDPKTVVKSGIFAGLLTSGKWEDRILGVSEDVTLVNDRMWVLTGNNIRIGEDIARRSFTTRIDSGVEHPEDRTDFAIQDIKGYTRDRRADLVASLIIIARHWVQEGMKVDPVRSDDFERWQSVMSAVLRPFTYEVVVDGKRQVRTLASDLAGRRTRASESEDDVEFSIFIEKVWDIFGNRPFTGADLADHWPAAADDLLPAYVKAQPSRATAFSYYFRTKKGRVAGPYRFSDVSRPRRHWMVSRREVAGG